MKIAFTTLGCPGWDLDTMIRRAVEFGFHGIDFRGYLDTLDVTQLPAFSTHAGQTRRLLTDSGLVVSGISTSITLCVPEKRDQNLEEARRSIDTAIGLGAKFLRVFGGGDPRIASRTEMARTGAETMRAILDLDGARTLRWCFETHDQWIQSSDCRLLLDAIPEQAFGALWDMGHTPRVGMEMPAATFASLAGRVYYTHVKDAEYNPRHPLAMGDGWRYVLPGTGMLPLTEAVDVLKSHDYQGWLVFEHEKRWHPNLLEPEIAFKAFAEWARKVI